MSVRPTWTTAYDPGDTVRLSFTITSTPVSTAYANSNCHLDLLPPVGVLRTLTSTSTASSPLEHDSLGHYHYDLIPTTTEAGRWRYRFVSTGAVKQSQQGVFAVRNKVTST
jgi:uncharacterized protein YfaS (alpha-2-macroglobulin family)